MYRAGMCGGYCEPFGLVSKKDRKVFLEEHKKVLEAKLATIKHLKESLEKEKDEDLEDK